MTDFLTMNAVLEQARQFRVPVRRLLDHYEGAALGTFVQSLSHWFPLLLIFAVVFGLHLVIRRIFGR